MHYKLVVCSCYYDLIVQRENQAVSRCADFNCSCSTPHEVFVWACPHHLKNGTFCNFILKIFLNMIFVLVVSKEDILLILR